MLILAAISNPRVVLIRGPLSGLFVMAEGGGPTKVDMIMHGSISSEAGFEKCILWNLLHRRRPV